MPICTSKQAAIIVVFPMWLGILHYHRKQPFISFFLWFQFHVCMKGILPSNCDLTSNIGSSFPPVLSDTQAARSPCSCLGWGDHNIILENRVMWQNMLGPGCHMANPCLYWHTLMANKTCSVRFLTQTQYHPIPSHNSIPYYIYIRIQLLYILTYIYICMITLSLSPPPIFQSLSGHFRHAMLAEKLPAPGARRGEVFEPKLLLEEPRYIRMGCLGYWQIFHVNF